MILEKLLKQDMPLNPEQTLEKLKIEAVNYLINAGVSFALLVTAYQYGLWIGRLEEQRRLAERLEQIKNFRDDLGKPCGVIPLRSQEVA